MVKFGVMTSGGLPGMGYEYARKVALECERFGFKYWLNDHLMSYPRIAETPWGECFTTLAALSRDTEKLRFGTMVVCNLFRNPAVLAKMCASLDVLSGGRFELGLGSGDFEFECDSLGIPFPKKPSERIAMMREGVMVLKKLWTENRPSFQGKYYTLKEAIMFPKPVQKPHPPIWVGAGAAGGSPTVGIIKTSTSLRAIAELGPKLDD